MYMSSVMAWPWLHMYTTSAKSAIENVASSNPNWPGNLSKLLLHAVLLGLILKSQGAT